MEIVADISKAAKKKYNFCVYSRKWLIVMLEGGYGCHYMPDEPLGRYCVGCCWFERRVPTKYFIGLKKDDDLEVLPR